MSASYSLHLEMETHSGKFYSLDYSHISVGGNETGYLFSVSGYDDNGHTDLQENIMTSINGKKFTHPGEDNDGYEGIDFAAEFGGA